MPLELSNDHLTVEILHPVADAAKLGSRYAHGGYVWQVFSEAGALLSGPAFPAATPPVFDGQGLPEAFRPMPLEGNRSAVPGVGTITDEADPEPDGSGQVRGKQVVETLQWTISQTASDYKHADSIRMESSQPMGGGATLRMAKTVTLDGSTVRCGTEVELVGGTGAACELVWFSHPFFPLTEDGVVCTFGFETQLEDEGDEGSRAAPRSFHYDTQGQLCMDLCYNWVYAEGGGSFKQLSGVEGHALSAQAYHPLGGSIGCAGSFPLQSMPIWANEKTVSFEPYFTPTIESGAGVTQWEISFDFAGVGAATARSSGAEAKL
jgi:hypothetical protein